jgi:hypothetical protein
MTIHPTRYRVMFAFSTPEALLDFIDAKFADTDEETHLGLYLADALDPEWEGHHVKKTSFVLRNTNTTSKPASWELKRYAMTSIPKKRKIG